MEKRERNAIDVGAAGGVRRVSVVHEYSGYRMLGEAK